MHTGEGSVHIHERYLERSFEFDENPFFRVDDRLIDGDVPAVPADTGGKGTRRTPVWDVE